MNSRPEAASRDTETLAADVSHIADQLSLTVDGNFDLHVSCESEEVSVQKLSMMVNFLLDNVRRALAAQREVQENLEHLVAQRTAQLSLILEGSNDGVWVWDIAGQTLALSARWLAISGLAGLPTEGNSVSVWFDHVHSHDRAGLHDAIRRHLEGLLPHVEAEYRMRSADGTSRWMLCRGVCRRDQRGEPLMLAGTQTDITLRRHLDPATGQPNEQFLLDRLAEMQEEGRDATLVLLGFDGQAQLAEALAPAQTREFLRLLLQRLTQCLPLAVPMALLPGKSVGVILPGGAPEALALTETILTRLCEEPIQPGGAERRWLSPRAGVVPLRDMTGHEADAILSAAWTALRHAREGRRRERIAVYDPAQRRQSEKDLADEVRLREALDHTRVEAFFQPLIHLLDGTLAGFEALARMRAEDGTAVSPAEFIPVAERTGLIAALGAQILEQALARLAEWRRQGLVDGRATMSVNLAAAQIADPHLPRDLATALRRHGLPASCLKVEVTETVLVEDLDMALESLNAVRALGVRVALDDFGTGYSSLSYLRRLPVDILKIDRSFVTDINALSDKCAITGTICALGRTLGLELVAEGIETEAEEEALRAMGVQYAQGYLYSRPMSGGDIPAMIPRMLREIGAREMWESHSRQHGRNRAAMPGGV
ncbi:EAL domain-containing protein [Roseomonas gilardii]|uniref:EAL domain-containing protein n=1 Tax=Roseomonas gilardii TaxID=257708 RepID=A0ABU3MCR6_9PROT|nr:EAL domain-containing protein [Roseomonas gilardii]MDT8330703.1 EAL domain-containing protein [Roseomonas gilardii]